MPRPFASHRPGRRLRWYAVRILLLVGAVMLAGSHAELDAQEPNYDESKVPSYTLPDPLVTEAGHAVTTPEAWTGHRRGEVLRLFETHVYGKAPAAHPEMKFRLEESAPALDGRATRKQVTILFNGTELGPKLHLLIYLPSARTGPVPAFLGLNFYGNHTVNADPAILLPTSWMRDNAEKGVADNRATAAGRGVSASRWPVELILARGYALATAYYGDIDPDFDDGFQNGVHPLFARPGQTRPDADEWGSIAAWAWGLSRALDYLETDADVNPRRVVVMGHSRLGKTALWAGACDERFALVISNNSGCGGAALSRRAYGETVARINRVFPHWFCGNFKQYGGREVELPVDQHQLLALIAPRPLYVASAVEDRWADPRGEFLSCVHADPVYRLLGTSGLPTKEWPQPNQPLHGTIGYHVRSGKHDVTTYDWERYLDFAAAHKLRE